MEFQINKKDLEKINILNTQLGYPQGIFYFLRKKNIKILKDPEFQYLVKKNNLNNYLVDLLIEQISKKNIKILNDNKKKLLIYFEKKIYNNFLNQLTKHRLFIEIKLIEGRF